VSSYTKKAARMTDRKLGTESSALDAVLAPLLAKRKVLLDEQTRRQAGGKRVGRARKLGVHDPDGIDCIFCSEPYDLEVAG
jgi:hypothetical protein